MANMWTSHGSAALSALLVASALGCGSDGETTCGGADIDGNKLSGSYCEDIEMPFTGVALLLVDSTQTLRIEYFNGQRSAKTLQILLTPGVVELEPDRAIHLVEAGASVRRFTTDAPEPINLTGELESTSTLTFSEYEATVGSRAAGTFNLLFESGRTLEGEFNGVVADACGAVPSCE